MRSLKEGEYWDTKLPAFGIRVGVRTTTYLLKKGSRRVKLGTYPATNLAEARKRALKAKAGPLDHTTTPTFPEALEAFLAQNKWRPYSKYVLENSLRNHFTWKRPVDKITHEDVALALDTIKAPSTRAHALKDIRSFFNWCIPRYLKASPCAGLKMPAYKPRQRVLTDDELRRVWIACGQSGQFGVIVKLLILTGQRKNEIGKLQWNYIKTDRITLPSSATKNGKQHSFPLSSMSSSIIKDIGTSLQVEGYIGPLIFPADGKRSVPYNGWGKHLKELQKNSDTTGWTLHDLRRTFASGLAALGTPIHVTEKLLNHVSGTHSGIVSVYQIHSYWPEQVAALSAWENKLQSLCSTG